MPWFEPELLGFCTEIPALFLKICLLTCSLSISLILQWSKVGLCVLAWTEALRLSCQADCSVSWGLKVWFFRRPVSLNGNSLSASLCKGVTKCKCIYTHVHRSAESCRYALFLADIFIMLNNFIAAEWSVKGSHNKCWGFGIAALPVARRWIMIRLCVVWTSCLKPDAIWLTFRWGQATVIHMSNHSGLKTNVELSWKGHFVGPFVIWVDTPLHAKSSGFSLLVYEDLSVAFQVWFKYQLVIWLSWKHFL